jgi:hypothetical protein
MIFALLWIGIVLKPIRMHIRHSILIPDPDPIPQQCQFTCFMFHGSVVSVSCQHFNVSDTTLKKAGCESVTFWYGSGSGSFRLFSSLTFKMLTKKFLKVNLHYSSKCIKKLQNSRYETKVFLNFLLDGGLRIRTNNDGSGNGRSKIVRIRIHKTGEKKFSLALD